MKSFIKDITPVILTYNEIDNIKQTIDSLSWANDIVVVDSGSTDGTLDFLNSQSNVRVFFRNFDLHANQWNFAITDTKISTNWVLALDADYVLPGAFIDELINLEPKVGCIGFKVKFKYVLGNKILLGSMYPPGIVLYKVKNGLYFQDGHTQRLHISGGHVAFIQSFVFHHDKKSLSRWLGSQLAYAKLESSMILLKVANKSKLSLKDRIRLMFIVSPLVTPIYFLIVKGGIFNGVHGIFYALQRSLVEIIIALYLIEDGKIGKR